MLNLLACDCARLCPNSTGADIRSVCTEAGMFAIRARRKTVTEKDFLDAVNKVRSPHSIPAHSVLHPSETLSGEFFFICVMLCHQKSSLLIALGSYLSLSMRRQYTLKG